MLTEYLPGEELTVDCILKENILKKIIIRKRDQMRAGISTKGRFINDQDIYDYTSKILFEFSYDKYEYRPITDPIIPPTNI